MNWESITVSLGVSAVRLPVMSGNLKPDITGEFSRAYQSRGNKVSGCFAQDGSILYQETGTNYQVNGLTFKSSRSSSIYGSSTIVQPKSLQHLTIVKT